MAIAGEIEVLIKSEVTKAIRDLKKYDSSLGTSRSKIKEFADSAKKVGATMTKMFTLPVLAAGGAGIKFAADIEAQKTAFGVLLEDVEKGAALFEQLKEFSASTPLQLDDITQGAQTLLAFGVASEEVQDKLSNLGDLAQGNAGKMQSLTEAYGKLRAKGVATLEEINRFTENGVPLLDALADQMGVATDEVLRMVTEGSIGFEDVDAAIRAMTGSGGQFEGMMEKIAQTTRGKFSTALDNVKLALADLVDTLLPTINRILDGITSLAQKFGSLDEGTQDWILTIGSMLALTGPILSMVSMVSKAVMGLAAGAFMGPQGIIFAIGAAIAILTGFILKLTVFKKEAQTLMKDVKQRQDEIAYKLIEINNERLVEEEDLVELAEQYKLSLDQVREVALDVLGIYDQQNIKLEEQKETSEQLKNDLQNRLDNQEKLEALYASTVAGQIAALQEQLKWLDSVQWSEFNAQKVEAAREKILDDIARLTDDTADSTSDILDSTEDIVKEMTLYQKMLNDVQKKQDAQDMTEEWKTYHRILKDIAKIEQELQYSRGIGDDSLTKQLGTLELMKEELEDILGLNAEPPPEKDRELPDIVSSLGEIGEMISSGGSWWEVLVNAFISAASEIEGFSEVLNIVTTTFQEVLAIIGDDFVEALRPVVDGTRNLGMILGTVLEPVFESLAPFLYALNMIVETIVGTLFEHFAPALNIIGAILEAIAPILQGVGSLLNLLLAPLRIINAALSALTMGLSNLLSGLFSSDDYSSALDSVDSFIDGIDEAVYSIYDFTDELEAQTDKIADTTAALDLYREYVDMENEIYRDKIKALDRLYDEELYGLRRLLDLRLITWEDYIEGVEDLNARYTEEKDYIDAFHESNLEKLDLIRDAIESGLIQIVDSNDTGVADLLASIENGEQVQLTLSQLGEGFDQVVGALEDYEVSIDPSEVTGDTTNNSNITTNFDFTITITGGGDEDLAVEVTDAVTQAIDREIVDAIIQNSYGFVG